MAKHVCYFNFFYLKMYMSSGTPAKLFFDPGRNQLSMDWKAIVKRRRVSIQLSAIFPRNIVMNSFNIYREYGLTTKK